MSRMNLNKAREIRLLVSAGEFTRKEIADSYGISVQQVGRIFREESWPEPSAQPVFTQTLEERRAAESQARMRELIERGADRRKPDAKLPARVAMLED